MIAGMVELIYLLAAVLFIVGLKWMSSPAKALRGNLLSSVGMLLAIVVTLFDRQILSYQLIALGMLVGSAVGLWMARAVPMTAMPQMVGVLNGFGGGASLMVAAAEWHRLVQPGAEMTADTAITIYASTLVGGVTFAGSMIAGAKLQELISGKPILFKGQHWLNLVMVLAVVVLGAVLTMQPDQGTLFVVMIVLALVLGVTLVIPIGGADMPVVICLLNSYSGIAGSLTGFVIKNDGLIITGALVGASGIILTNIMCKAMNRSIWNVLFGGFGATVSGAIGDREKALAARGVRQVTAEDAAALLAYSKLVMIVPGYGLAVAQGQHQVQELAGMLGKRGVEVKFAIHPVAGRMPGHMNVLLADANVPYPSMLDMDQANPEMERTDVVLVVGANDVVNPASRNNPQSPIWGMPILDVDKAKQIIVMKRSMNPGFAGIDNELFYDAKTAMLFGDAKKSLAALITEVRQVE